MEVEERGLNPNQLWKIKKRLCPDSRDPPCAMLDRNGNLLTTDKSIKDRALEVYSQRLEPNEIEENLKELEVETNKICELRMKECKENKSDPWD